MQPYWTLNLEHGIQVNVPADLDNPVTLTLLELEDWPEPELAFLRQLAQPGQRMLDADTGYGPYALSLAQALQGQGRVLAHNPNPLFARSIADNGLQAVLQTEGEAREHPDNQQDQAALDLIRLGATTALDPRWLRQADPLILLPSDSEALADLQAADLGLYRLIPALGALVAWTAGTDASAAAVPEKPALLFACNDTRTAWLRERGWLIDDGSRTSPTPSKRSRFSEKWHAKKDTKKKKKQSPASLYQEALKAEQSGALERAQTDYRTLLALQPDHAGAAYRLGAILYQRGDATQAEALIRRAIATSNQIAACHYDHGIVLASLLRFDEALQAFEQALRLEPDYAEAHNNRGIALNDLGRKKDALHAYDQALRLKPDFAEAHNNRGIALYDLGRLQDALQAYDHALRLKPDFAKAHNNRGNTLKDLGQINAALQAYDQALRFKPDYAEAHANRATPLQSLGRLDEALRAYDQALQLKPDYAEARSNHLFALSGLETGDDAAILALARRYGSRYPRTLPALAHLSAPAAGRRLRVGYVSGDFRQHAVAHFFEPLLAQHEPARIELWAYTTNGQQDTVTDRIRVQVDHWQSIVGLSDETAAERIRSDRVDVLVDLSNHTQHNRLGVFAQRAAPVQVEYLGHFSTTGVAEIDYWIGDSEQTPPSMEAHYSETLWRLPRVAHVYHGAEAAPSPAWQPAEDGALRLGCFHNVVKLTPRTIALWSRVLRELPEATLVLKSKQLSDADRREQLANAFAAEGIGAERLALRDHSATRDWAAYMRAYDELDIALDPIGPWRGAATNCDALWMGVPVVTLRGERLGSRQTASLLHALGRAHWIADDEDSYIERVVALARDVDGRRALRFQQRAQMRDSPLCDAKGLAQALEDAYEAMFQRWWNEGRAQEPSETPTHGPVWLATPTAPSEPSIPPMPQDVAPINLIHVLARSGGTLISRCLGAMTGVYLFSEVHPQSAAAARPTGSVDQFSLHYQANAWYGLLDAKEGPQDAERLTYADWVERIAARVAEHGGQLVLRDWSHLDFHAVPFLPAATHRSTHAEHLAERFALRRVSLVRHPVFQWLSLERLPLIRGRLTLAAFMAGYLAFARLAVKTGFVRLEDFVGDPDASLHTLCDQLHLPFDPGYRARWPDNHWVTGDFISARMTPKEILYRPKIISADVLAQFDALAEYQDALRLLGYRSPQAGKMQEAAELVSVQPA